MLQLEDSIGTNSLNSFGLLVIMPGAYIFGVAIHLLNEYNYSFLLTVTTNIALAPVFLNIILLICS